MPTGAADWPNRPPRAPWPGPVDQAARLSETHVAFARACLRGFETAIAFAGEKRVFFGAFFGCSGDAGFSGSLLEVSSGVVGFNVAALSRLVREKVRPAWSDGGCERDKVRPAHEKWPKIGVLWSAGRTFSRKCCWRGRDGRVFSRQSALRRSWMQRGALQAGCGGGFAALEAGWRRVAGVSQLS